jgi:hypothetical protein
MNGRLENIQEQVRRSTGSGLQAELRYLLDRVLKRDRIIGSLTPEQWKSVASRVPPGHRKERDTLSRIARLARELQEEAGEEAVTEDPAAVEWPDLSRDRRASPPARKRPTPRSASG